MSIRGPVSTVLAHYRPLLDYIGGKESSRAYNDVYAPARKYLNRQLTDMTISEVQAWQRHTWRNYGRKYFPEGSVAVGRYQFIMRTLDDAVRRLGLSGDQKFDEATQDLLGAVKLYDRGLWKFHNGKQGMDTTMNKLAMEWASLPVATRVYNRQYRLWRNPGQSYYPPPNKSATTVAEVRGTLTRALASARRSTGSGDVVVVSLKPSTRPRPERKPTRRPVARPARKVEVKNNDSVVVRYQKWLNLNGAIPTLRVDGIVGSRTRSAARSLNRSISKDLAWIQSGKKLAPAGSARVDVIRKFISQIPNGKQVVEAYQTILNMKLGATEQLKVDGIYGAKTHAVVARFMRSNLHDLKQLARGSKIS